MNSKGWILVIGCLLIAHNSRAVKHFVTLNAQVGEHSWLTKTDAVSANSSFGIGGGIGVNYELQQRHFLFSAGLAANPSYSVFTLEPYQIAFEGYDTQLDQLFYTYKFYDRTDAYTNLSLQVPIMVGGQFDRFYFLVGAKLDLSLFARAKASTLVATTGKYPQYIGAFHDMIEHAFFTDYPVEMRNNFTFNLNALASVELGVRLGDNYKLTGFGSKEKSKIQYRIAVYADYGLLNSIPAQPIPLYSTPTVFNEADMYSQVQIMDLVHSAGRDRVAPLQVGVKFTVLFRVGDPKKCVICQADD